MISLLDALVLAYDIRYVHDPLPVLLSFAISEVTKAADDINPDDHAHIYIELHSQAVGLWFLYQCGGYCDEPGSCQDIHTKYPVSSIISSSGVRWKGAGLQSRSYCSF